VETGRPGLDSAADASIRIAIGDVIVFIIGSGIITGIDVAKTVVLRQQ
jgi:hypothetical protein